LRNGFSLLKKNYLPILTPAAPYANNIIGEPLLFLGGELTVAVPKHGSARQAALLLEQGGFDALALPTGDVGKGVNAPDHSAQRPEYCITLAILKDHTLFRTSSADRVLS
jgi:hypothetical protein